MRLSDVSPDEPVLCSAVTSWDKLSDQELVEKAGAAAGMAPAADRARAQAEMSKRLVVALQSLRVETASSNTKMATLTNRLVSLTVVLVVLTVVLVFIGVLTLIDVLAADDPERDAAPRPESPAAVTLLLNGQPNNFRSNLPLALP